MKLDISASGFTFVVNEFSCSACNDDDDGSASNVVVVPFPGFIPALSRHLSKSVFTPSLAAAVTKGFN